MNIQFKLHTDKKEKETILSLFRLPLNYFSDNKDEYEVEIETHPMETETEFKISPQSNLEAEVFSHKESKIQIQSQPLSSEKSSTPTSSPTSHSSATLPSNLETSPTTETISPVPPSETETTSTTNSSTTDNSSTTSEPTSPQPNTNISQTQETPSIDSGSSDFIPSVPSTSAQNKHVKTADKSHESKTPNDKKSDSQSIDKKSDSQSTDKTPNIQNSNKTTNTKSSNNQSDSIALEDARNMKKKSPNDKTSTNSGNDSTSPLDKMRDIKKKTSDGIKNQAKKVIPKNVQNTATNIKNKADDIKNKALSTAAPVINAAQTVDKLLNGSVEDKAEAIGAAALKGASTALKASGAGAPVGAAIDAVDKVIGNSEVGKTVKKTAGGCVFCACCSSSLFPMLLFLGLILALTSGLGWIFGLRLDSFEIDKTNLETAITEDLLFEETRSTDTTIYDILEDRLTDPIYGFKQLHYDPNGNIKIDEKTGQQSLIPITIGNFSNNYATTTLIPQGQFATAYEMLIGNYTVSMIKEPRHDTGMSSQHMPLFQNVLEENFTTLRSQFNNNEKKNDGQVRNDFWEDILRKCLYTHYYVYNPLTAEQIYVSLHDLLEETSSTTGDAEYDTRTVEAILNYTANPKNVELATEFRRLQEALARIEVMTYMMTIRDFYAQKAEFLDNLRHDYDSGKVSENYDFFANSDFFDQFLLIPDVESYMALSSTTGTPAFAYDIATSSMKQWRESNAPRETRGDKVYYFFETMNTWAASYKFYNSIDENGGYSIVCTDIIPTKLEENLYKRYNITDPESFFMFFEISTGIELSTTTDASTFFLSTSFLPHETEAYFPLEAKTSITHGYKQEYSTETMQKFGISQAEHKGVDFSAKIGTPVLAIKDGTVDEVGYNAAWGYYIVIRHNDGYSSLYAHGDEMSDLSKGTSVSAGDEIMLSGNSGNSTGPHLHLQVFETGKDKNTSHINPISYINGMGY